jgi:hypothetical protein
VADGVVDEPAEGLARRLGAVDVGDVDAQHEGGLVAPGKLCRQRRLAERELDGVRAAATSGVDRAGDVLDAGQESAARRRSRGRPATSMQRPDVAWKRRFRR